MMCADNLGAMSPQRGYTQSDLIVLSLSEMFAFTFQSESSCKVQRHTTWIAFVSITESKVVPVCGFTLSFTKNV